MYKIYDSIIIKKFIEFNFDIFDKARYVKNLENKGRIIIFV